MEMMIIIPTMLSVTLSLLLTVNAASFYTHQLQASPEPAKDNELYHSAMPRKIMVNDKAEDNDAKGLVFSNEQNKVSLGEPHKGEQDEAKVMVHAPKGTRQAWLEGSDHTTIHEFFTMDYSHVRRRRPIHNKSFPKTVTNSP